LGKLLFSYPEIIIPLKKINQSIYHLLFDHHLISNQNL
jgi:hypothetical protein